MEPPLGTRKVSNYFVFFYLNLQEHKGICKLYNEFEWIYFKNVQNFTYSFFEINIITIQNTFNS